ncbi:TPA: restriction endonuclease subunit S, partial [Salmonella enterica subsp. enterica serovar 16:l,v:-]
MSGVKLPEGWVVTNLQNIANWGSGGTPSRSHDEYYNGNIPWIKTGDLGPKLITEASEYITDAGVKNSSAKYFPKGSVAIAMYGATIGKTSILGIDATTNQACAVGSPIEGITSSIFLYYFLLNEKNAFIKKGKGGAQPNISQAVIKEHPLSLPPYTEQKIIAEKIDTLLAQVDNTKARLEQIPQILKRFRQAVLASALKGELTSKWRIANKNGQDISSFKDSVKKYRFENWVKEQEQKFLNKGKQPKNDSWKKKYQEAIISQDITGKEIPDGWLFEPLDGLVYISARIGWKGLKASEYTVKGPLFLSVHSLNYGKEVNLAQAYHISERRYNESPEIMLKNDDIL